MSKHTPGPWRHEYTNHVDGPDGDERFWEGWLIHGPQGEPIAETFGLKGKEANARLIAKAPELYEALRDLLPPPDEKPVYAWHDRARTLLARIDGGDK